MTTFYIILVAMLLTLALFDLFVGVGNDAVNFLSSAIGSKAFKFKILLIFAAVGIFCGATFSNGMMDIARHGIFMPQYYTFAELMCVFAAVMFTDVVLLDVFNSYGLPTSTTVSMVFELLGASVAIATIKIIDDNALNLGELINTTKAFSVIMGIFLSVAVAF
ncbi:MAG: inorganic phosphate transporter, partial [Bacteroidales bacterium]|nr:inorganic phosphate transporter [Bacteroidales bacterium]